MSLNNLIELEKYRSAEVPMDDWNIKGVFGDIMLCRFVDAQDGPGGEYVLRNGIAVPLDVTKHTWRIVEVLKKGPEVHDYIKEGDLLMIPNDRGIPCVQRHGKKKENLIFINESRAFCAVDRKGEASSEK